MESSSQNPSEPSPIDDCASSTVPVGQKKYIRKLVSENIKILADMRRDVKRKRSPQDRVADAITKFSGSMAFVYVHLIWFAVWIPVNLGWTSIKPFDEFPFGLLTMVVSLEAIFLSTFVLISQNRMGILDEERADLDLQVNLLAEHELTKLICVVNAIAEKVGVNDAVDDEAKVLQEQVSPRELLQELRKHESET